jgi:hypothetical protein
MNPILQTKFSDPMSGVRGNGLAACLASLLEKVLTDVPAFENFPLVQQRIVVTNWLDLCGYGLIEISQTQKFKGYSLVFGLPARPDDTEHCVIYKGSRLCHDPHPSGLGLRTVHRREILVPYRPK